MYRKKKLPENFILVATNSGQSSICFDANSQKRLEIVERPVSGSIIWFRTKKKKLFTHPCLRIVALP
jgi:hypothetical protein